MASDLTSDLDQQHDIEYSPNIVLNQYVQVILAHLLNCVALLFTVMDLFSWRHYTNDRSVIQKNHLPLETSFLSEIKHASFENYTA